MPTDTLLLKEENISYMRISLGENQTRRCFDYAPQQRVLKKKWKPRKLDKRTSGPYEIAQTHVNGTVIIQLKPGLTERINIRRIIPYRGNDQ